MSQKEGTQGKRLGGRSVLGVQKQLKSCVASIEERSEMGRGWKRGCQRNGGVYVMEFRFDHKSVKDFEKKN